MKKKKIITSLSLLAMTFLVNLNAYSQCKEMYAYRSGSYPDKSGVEMFFPLIWEFRSDTLLVKNADLNKPNEKIVYSVIKSNCEWNSDQSTGKAEYEVVAIENGKQLSITILAENEKATISLLYNEIGSTPREFKAEKYKQPIKQEQ